MEDLRRPSKRFPVCRAQTRAALFAAEARGRPEAVRIAKWTIARCLRSLGQVEEAPQRVARLREPGEGR